MYKEIVEKRAHLIEEQMKMVSDLPVSEQSLSFLKGMEEILKMYHPDAQTVVWDFEKMETKLDFLKSGGIEYYELQRNIRENIESYESHHNDLRRLYKLVTFRINSIQDELGTDCESEVDSD